MARDRDSEPAQQSARSSCQTLAQRSVRHPPDRRGVGARCRCVFADHGAFCVDGSLSTASSTVVLPAAQPGDAGLCSLERVRLSICVSVLANIRSGSDYVCLLLNELDFPYPALTTNGFFLGQPWKLHIPFGTPGLTYSVNAVYNSAPHSTYSLSALNPFFFYSCGSIYASVLSCLSSAHPYPISLNYHLACKRCKRSSRHDSIYPVLSLCMLLHFMLFILPVVLLRIMFLSICQRQTVMTFSFYLQANLSYI
jgi:hypothetical protein